MGRSKIWITLTIQLLCAGSFADFARSAETSAASTSPTISPGTTPEYASAIEVQETTEDLLARSAKGSAAAMEILSGRYLDGDGVKQNIPEAHRLLREAWRLTQWGGTSEPASFNCVGVCEIWFDPQPWELPVDGVYGRIGPDPAELERRAKAGDPISMRRLGQVFIFGDYMWLIGEDRARSEYWFRRAALTGDKESFLPLAALLRRRGSNEALVWYNRAVFAKLPGAGTGLASFYRSRGQKGDEGRAFSAILAGARAGDPDAMEELARLYKDGDGVKANLSEAKKWCSKAVKATNSPISAEPYTLERSPSGTWYGPACLYR